MLRVFFHKHKGIEQMTFCRDRGSASEIIRHILEEFRKKGNMNKRNKYIIIVESGLLLRPE